jgi:ankyrin repeat protein
MPAIVTYLESGGDINGRSASGSTLLIEAARAGQGELVGGLLSRGSSVEQGDSTGTTALHVAAENGHISVVESLIKAHQVQDLSVDVRNQLGKPPLFYATINKHRDTVFKLLNNGASIFALTKSNNSVLHIAAYTGDVALITAILDYYKKNEYYIDFQSAPDITPLMLAIVSGNLEAVKVFIQADANPFLKGTLKESGMVATECTALHVAAMYGKDDIAEYLVDYILRNDQSIDPVSPEVGTPLMIWASVDKLELVRKLIEKGADILKSDDSQEMVLHTAADGGATKVLGYLLKYCQDNNIDVVNARSKLGDTPLMSAAVSGEQKAFDLLLQYGADLNLRDRMGWTILAQAVSSKSPDFLRHVIREYRKNKMSIDELFDDRTALSHAIAIDAVDQVTVLLEEGAQRDYRFQDGNTLIGRTVLDGTTEALKALLTVNISDDARLALVDAQDNLDQTALMLASGSNKCAFIRMLLEYGADFDKRSNIDLAPLHYAASTGPEATKVLLEAGANPNISNNAGITPIGCAVTAYNLACAKLLVKHGALLNNENHIILALRQAPAERYPQSDAMSLFLLSQGAILPAAAPQVPLRLGSIERLAFLREQDAPYAEAIAAGPAAVRALLETPGLRPLRWRDTRMAKHANNGTYELLLAKARADEGQALYEGSQRVFVSYIADTKQKANPHYKGEEEKKVVPCNLVDILKIICGPDKRHLPQYPHLTKEDIEQVRKDVLSTFKPNAYTLAKWRAIQAHMADPGNEEYKGFPGAPEKIAELKAGAAAAAPEGEEAPRALLLSGSGKRGAASRPSAAAASRPAKQAKAMAEADLGEAEKPPKGKRAKRKPN